MRTLISGLLLPILLSADALLAQQPCTAEKDGQCAPAVIVGIAKDETAQAWTPVTAAIGEGPLDTFILRPSASYRQVFQRNRGRGFTESVPVDALARPNGVIARARQDPLCLVLGFPYRNCPEPTADPSRLVAVGAVSCADHVRR